MWVIRSWWQKNGVLVRWPVSGMRSPVSKICSQWGCLYFCVGGIALVPGYIDEVVVSRGITVTFSLYK